MLDCWKNSCHGATVVPTMAMINSTDVEVNPPWTPGVTKPLKNGPAAGWLKMARGMTRKFNTMKMNMNRSQRRKLPVAVMATSSDSGDGHRDVLADPEVVGGRGSPR